MTKVTARRLPYKKVKPYLLFELNSLPLGELIRDMGIASDNFRAETVFLNLGYVVHGKANYRNAVKAVESIFTENGLRLYHTVLADGSGLSRDNRTSAETLVGVLNLMINSPHREDFAACLPLAGKTGTLKKRFRGHPLNGSLIAKTGTLNGVTSLSGYLLDAGQPTYSFSFIANKLKSQAKAWQTLERAGTILSSLIN